MQTIERLEAKNCRFRARIKTLEADNEDSSAKYAEEKHLWLVERTNLLEEISLLRDYHQKDHLTGLSNRAGFDNSLAAALTRSKRNNSECAVIFFDLDCFKDVNDTLGHTKGDDVLRCLGALLKSICRMDETVSRYGGDEFAVILDDTDTQGALSAAHRYCDAVREEFQNEKIPLTFSAGVCVSSQVEESQADGLTTVMATMINAADAAMYRAKKELDVSVYLYDPDIDKKH